MCSSSESFNANIMAYPLLFTTKNVVKIGLFAKSSRTITNKKYLQGGLEKEKYFKSAAKIVSDVKINNKRG